MNSDDLEEFNRIAGEWAYQTSVALNDLIPLAEKMMASIVEGISETVNKAAEILPEWIDAYKEAWNNLPNNWLKMHGYPMRRRKRK